jgi:hypothetical protein
MIKERIFMKISNLLKINQSINKITQGKTDSQELKENIFNKDPINVHDFFVANY